MYAICNNILKYNSGENSMKIPFAIYAYLECFLEKMSRVAIILKNHQQLN